MESPKYSVIIITRNRGKLLAKLLESLIALDDEHDKYEIIVVDNNSNDNTAYIVERFRLEGAGNIHYVFEPKIGMSRARNTGAAVAKGEILLFIDDDAIPSKHWLSHYGILYQMFPGIAAAGGRIELVFESCRPKWLSDELLVALGYLDICDKETTLSFPTHPFGGNFSVKKETFKQVGGFIEDLAHSNEEKAFFQKLDLNKYEVGYSPKAFVYHHISRSKLRKVSFVKRGIRQGLSNVKVMLLFDPKYGFQFRKRVTRLVLDGLLIFRNVFFCREKYSFSQIYHFCIQWGEFLGTLVWGYKGHEYRSYSHADEAS